MIAQRWPFALCLAAVSLANGACTLVGEGEGTVTSSRLIVKDCWDGPFDLRPDFFAAPPYRDTIQLRVQRGSDLQEVSDGLAILVNEVPSIRESQLGTALPVGLPPLLVNEIAPGAQQGAPPLVSMALYLQFSCHNQNSVLYAVGGTITFEKLFSGDPNESVGEEKITKATLDVVLADPGDADPGTLDFPPGTTSQLIGDFEFLFQRGQPGQPFP